MTMRPSASSAVELQRSCPLCQQDNRHSLRAACSRATWNLKACRRCAFLYLENALGYEQLVREDCWSKTSRSERMERIARQPLVSRLRYAWKQLRTRLLPHPKALNWIRQFANGPRLLDIGCGNGRLLQKIGRDVVPFGIEIDRHAQRTSHAYAQTLGGRVYPGNALAVLKELPAEQFDTIVMLSYLEHETQPLAVLEQAARVLNPRGVVIIKVPNYACWNRQVLGPNWSGYRFPDHVNYFEPNSLAQMIVRSGLIVQRFQLRDRAPTSDNMWLLASKAA